MVWRHCAFAGRHAGTTSIWALPVSQTSLRANGKAQRLTSAEARDFSPSLAANGRLVFSRLAGALHVWRISNATNPRKAAVSKITQDAGLDVTPNISHDGRWLVFARRFGIRRDIWIRDTVSGAETMLN